MFADWLDVQLPEGAGELTEEGRNGLVAEARREVLLRTYPGTFLYPVLFAIIALISDDFSEGSIVGPALLCSSIAIVVARVAAYRLAMKDPTNRRGCAMMHLGLGVMATAALSTYASVVFLRGGGDGAAMSGFVVAAGLGSTVATISSAQKRLAFRWSGAALLPPALTLLFQGGSLGYGLGLLFLAYFALLIAGIRSGYDSYWRAQLSATLLDERAQQTVALSRFAGMAEIATNVLHDVGNTLNSVKTTLAGLIELHQRDPAPDLDRMATLLNEHTHDLVRFLTEDPRGRRLPAFFDAVAVEAALRNAEVGRELQRLCAHAEHIEVVVARQQDIAKGGGEPSTESLPQLVNDALELLGLHTAPPQADLQIIVPELIATVDRHRTLQVLVNLLKNSLDAVADVAKPSIFVRGSAREDGFVTLAISDNGCGADAQTVEQAFSRGFTTKLHGHGFGLHGAIAIAKAMGGSLAFRSPGVGMGATVELRLPAAARTARAA